MNNILLICAFRLQINAVVLRLLTALLVVRWLISNVYVNTRFVVSAVICVLNLSAYDAAGATLLCLRSFAG